jgi:hypothetical protein
MANNSGKKGLAVLAAGAAAAAAGYYFYGSQNAPQNRRKAAKWAGDLKNDVIREAKKLPTMDRTSMARVIDAAVTAYGAARTVDRADLMQAAGELKKHWSRVVDEAKGAYSKATSTRAPAVKKRAGAKKSAKKKAK